VPIQSAFGTLRRVLVRPPHIEALTAWREHGWRAAPDPDAAADEHARFRRALADAGAEVIVADEPVPGDPDAIYVYDPVLVTDAGAILLRPGKAARRAEPDACAHNLEAAGVPVIARLDGDACAEGGDMVFLDEETLLVGVGYRTNDAGVRRLRELLGGHGIRVESFDLPHQRGPGACLHLMSLLSMLDVDLAVAYPPLMPVRLVQLLGTRGVELVEVPEREFDSMGPNVLALGPRVALALEGNPETARRMASAGVDVRTYRGDEISTKGDGGPTCLTRPLERG
jgi:dimethylargininase